MLFEFQKITQPIWYFNLCPPDGRKWVRDTLSRDKNDFRRNWFLWNSYVEGVGMCEGTPLEDVQIVTNPLDNYRFIRMAHGSFWVPYVFIVRLLTLNNPFVEIWALLRSWKSNPELYQSMSLDSKVADDAFDADSQRPGVTVVIPTLNRYRYLEKVLEDLLVQTFDNFKIVVIDQSDDFNESFYEKFDHRVEVIRQEQKRLWKARNSGVRCSDTELIAFTEDDVRLPRDWLASHLECIEKYQADASCGVLLKSKPKDALIRFRLSDKFPTGNVLVRRRVFETVGFFDENFEGQRMGDGEFGLRAYLGGFKLVENPRAYCIDLKAQTGGLRHFGSLDTFKVRGGLLSPTPVPSVLYYVRKYFDRGSAIYFLLKSVPYMILPYRLKNRTPLYPLAYFLGLIASPFLVAKIRRSWKLASEMLKNPKPIEFK